MEKYHYKIIIESDGSIVLTGLPRHPEKGNLSQELIVIGKRCTAHIHQTTVAVEHGDMLYGADGMP